MKKYRIGYTQGVYDMFHRGHLNILNRAKEQCETLIVGVNSDALVKEYKQKTPVIGQEDRLEIVKNIKAVDGVVLADTLDKLAMHERVPFDAVFIGSDWQGSPRWEATQKQLADIGVDVVFLPHTEGITSTILRGVKEGVVRD